MKRRLIILLAITVACRLLLGCGEGPGKAGMSPSAYPYQVVTTVGMITDVVKRVAGDHAAVQGIIGEGVDPHLYAASTNDVKALRGADVIFYNGLMLEGKMSDVLVKVGQTTFTRKGLIETGAAKVAATN